MASNEGLDPHHKNGAPRDYLTATAFEAAFEAARRENRLILQGIQATLDQIAASLAPLRAQGDQQPPTVVIRDNPVVRRTPQVDNRRVTPDDSEPSDDEVEDIFVRRPALGNERVERAERDYRGKADLPSFNGLLRIEEFLDWLAEVERYFDYMEVPDDKKVKLIAYKFKSGASAWWENLQVSRTRQNKTPIRTWPRMRQLLRARFLPSDYEQILFQQYQNCRQGNRTVAEYLEEFQRLATRNNLSESEAQQVSRFIGGLRFAIQDRVQMHPVWTLSEANQFATGAETQLSQPPARPYLATRNPITGPTQDTTLAKGK